MDKCANCGQPADEHKTVKEYLWSGDFQSVQVCPTSVYRRAREQPPATRRGVADAPEPPREG